MATTADAILTATEKRQPLPNNIKLPPEQSSDFGHLPEEAMGPTRRREDVDIDRLETAIIAMAQAVTAQSAIRKPSVPAWVAAAVASVALLVSVTGAKWTSAGESDLKERIAVLSEKMVAAEERQKERERIADRERALIDERYRQMSITLESRGIKLPK